MIDRTIRSKEGYSVRVCRDGGRWSLSWGNLTISAPDLRIGMEELRTTALWNAATERQRIVRGRQRLAWYRDDQLFLSLAEVSGRWLCMLWTDSRQEHIGIGTTPREAYALAEYKARLARHSVGNLLRELHSVQQELACLRNSESRLQRDLEKLRNALDEMRQGYYAMKEQRDSLQKELAALRDSLAQERAALDRSIQELRQCLNGRGEGVSLPELLVCCRQRLAELDRLYSAERQRSEELKSGMNSLLSAATAMGLDYDPLLRRFLTR